MRDISAQRKIGPSSLILILVKLYRVKIAERAIINIHCQYNPSRYESYPASLMYTTPLALGDGV